jgi:hypothetical protein
MDFPLLREVRYSKFSLILADERMSRPFLNSTLLLKTSCSRHNFNTSCSIPLSHYPFKLLFSRCRARIDRLRVLAQISDNARIIDRGSRIIIKYLTAQNFDLDKFRIINGRHIKDLSVAHNASIYYCNIFPARDRSRDFPETTPQPPRRDHKIT